RLVNRLRTRSKSPLQGDHSEADDGPPLALTSPLESLHAIHLPAHIVRYRRVEVILGRREIVEGRVGAALWEQRGLVELEQILLHKPTHQVASIRFLAGPRMPLKPVRIDQLKEGLEVLLLAIVGSGGEKQEVARDRTEQFAQSVAFRWFGFVPVPRTAHLVSLVADDEIPFGLP